MVKSVEAKKLLNSLDFGNPFHKEHLLEPQVAVCGEAQATQELGKVWRFLVWQDDTVPL
jgi:hypothetical protein